MTLPMKLQGNLDPISRNLPPQPLRELAAFGHSVYMFQENAAVFVLWECTKGKGRGLGRTQTPLKVLSQFPISPV